MAEATIKERILAAIKEDGMSKDEAKSLVKALRAVIKDGDDGDDDDGEGLLPVLQKMQEALANMEKRVVAVEKGAKKAGDPPRKSFLESLLG